LSIIRELNLKLKIKKKVNSSKNFVATVNLQKVALLNTKCALLASNVSTAAQNARENTGKTDTTKNAKNFKKI